MIQNKAIFFDRDGVLNKDFGYVYKNSMCELENLNLSLILQGLRNKGYLMFMITNQSGIARGFYNESEFHKFNIFLEESLKFKFDRIYFCPHHPDFTGICLCRKPGIGMIEQADKDFGIDFQSSYIIGDKFSDILCGKNAGIKTIYYNRNSLQKVEADYIIDDLNDIRLII